MLSKLMKNTTTLGLCALVLCFASRTMQAQSTTQGAIAGTVFDSTGAVVGGAAETILNNGTNAQALTKSDSSGNYIFPLVEPGTYTLTVVAAGFEGFRAANVIVQVGVASQVDAHLTLGAASQTVEVTSQPPVLNFESPDFATIIDQTTIQNVPINNRRWSALALSTPGVVPDTSGFGLVSVRGISTLLNNVEIDGADDNQAYYSEERGRTREGYSTAGSAVREFAVNTGVYSAEYGRAAGGVINSVTKSGTNGFHGQVYGYDRQSNWAAYNDYTKQTVLVNGASTSIHLKPEDLRKIYGFTAGGPIIKDKLFWMYTYDQHTHIFPAISAPSTPSNFYITADAAAPSGSVCLATGQMTGLLATNANATTDQEACLMAARLNAAGYGAFAGGNTGYAAAAALFNTDLANLNTDLGEFSRSGYQEINTPKLDWQINPKEHVSFLYHRLRWDSPGGVQTQNPVFYGIDSTGTDFVKLDYGVSKLTSLITSNISNEVLYQYGHELNDEGQTPFSAYTKANLIGPTGDVPGVVLSSTGGGISEFGSPYYSYRLALPNEHKWQVEDTLYWNKGNHTFKFGGDLLHNADLINNTFESNGLYTYAYQSNYFTDLYLSQNGFTGTGGICNSAASQVFTTTGAGATPIGTAPCYTSYAQGYGSQIYGISTLDYAFFAQDNWKFSPRLTLELGLRYDQQLLPTQKASYVNPAELINGVAVGNNHPSDKNNFGPRIGFSWDPYGSGKTAVRGGFGMYYGRLTNGVILNALLNSGFGSAQYTTNFNSTATSSVPAGPKFPNISPVGVASVPVSPSVEYLDAHLQNPMVEEFDLAVQQELGKGTILSLNYLGALGKELTNFLDYNLNPNTEETVNVTVSDTTNKGPLGPNNTIIPVKVFTSYNTTGTSFGAITDVISNINSNYNAFVAELQNHALKSVQFDVSYTWSHSLDYNQNATTTTSTTNWLDPYANPRSNYGNGLYNTPNNLKAYVVYNLPNFVSKGNWASYLTNGWSIDDSFNSGSGLPLSMTVSGNVASNHLLSGWNGGGDSAYIPNVGRNTYKYPRHIVDDSRVQKRIDFTERYNLALFLNVFNVANHENIDGLNTTGYAFTGGTTSAVTATYQATTFGTVTSSNSSGFLFTPRELEIGAKFSF